MANKRSRRVPLEPSTPSPWAMKTWCAEPPSCSAVSSWPWLLATTRRPCSAWKSASRWCARLRANYPQVQVESFSGLLRDFVVARGGKAMVRGLRAVTDFDYEFQLAGMNRSLMPEVETVFPTPATSTSSSAAPLCAKSPCWAARWTNLSRPPCSSAWLPRSREWLQGELCPASSLARPRAGRCFKTLRILAGLFMFAAIYSTPLQ